MKFEASTQTEWEEADPEWHKRGASMRLPMDAFRCAFDSRSATPDAMQEAARHASLRSTQCKDNQQVRQVTHSDNDTVECKDPAFDSEKSNTCPGSLAPQACGPKFSVSQSDRPDKLSEITPADARADAACKEDVTEYTALSSRKGFGGAGYQKNRKEREVTKMTGGEGDFLEQTAFQDVQESIIATADFAAEVPPSTELSPAVAKMSKVQRLERQEFVAAPCWTALKGELSTSLWCGHQASIDSFHSHHGHVSQHVNGNQTDRERSSWSSWTSYRNAFVPKLALGKARQVKNLAMSERSDHGSARSARSQTSGRMCWPGSNMEVPPLPAPPENHPLLTPRTGACAWQTTPKQAKQTPFVPRLPLSERVRAARGTPRGLDKAGCGLAMSCNRLAPCSSQVAEVYQYIEVRPLMIAT